MGLLTTTIGAYPQTRLYWTNWLVWQFRHVPSHPWLGCSSNCYGGRLRGYPYSWHPSSGARSGQLRHRHTHRWWDCERELNPLPLSTAKWHRFEILTEKTLRTGNYSSFLPTVRGPVISERLFLANDWCRAQQANDKPVKITMPGPLTTADTLADEFYGDH